MSTPLAQDPNELFDVVTADGEPTGITKRRADVHRDGDWHRSVHIWVYSIDDTGPFLLMNQRGRHKDTAPRALDATVGGHLGAGESVEDAYREIEEEIGISVPPDSLLYLGRRARESNGLTSGVIDREIEEIYVCRDDRPLGDFRPNPAELEGLVRLSLANALILFVRGTAVDALRCRADNGVIEQFEARVDSLAIEPGDDYFGRVAKAIRRIVRGETDVSL